MGVERAGPRRPNLSHLSAFVEHGRIARFLRNWSIDALFRAHTAIPVNILTGSRLFNVFSVSRPDLVEGDSPLSPRLGRSGRKADKLGCVFSTTAHPARNSRSQCFARIWGHSTRHRVPPTVYRDRTLSTATPSRALQCFQSSEFRKP